MEALKQEVQRLRAQAGGGASFSEVAEGLLAAFARHPEALDRCQGRYRLRATDTGLQYSFALSAAGCRALGEQEPVDAALSGREAALLGVLSGALSPAKAMLTGQIRLEGSMKALSGFAGML